LSNSRFFRKKCKEKLGKKEDEKPLGKAEKPYVRLGKREKEPAGGERKIFFFERPRCSATGLFSSRPEEN